MSIEIDRSKWSPASQRSSGGHYDKGARHYENISYRCAKCFALCIFTAEEQKDAYEVRKEYVWRIPSLCPSCVLERDALRTQLRECQRAWSEGRESLASDRVFLERWRLLLREIETFGKRGGNPSVVAMISKLLG